MGTVVGIDLSLTGTGLAAIRDISERNAVTELGSAYVLDTHLVKSKGKRDDDLDTRRNRLVDLLTQVLDFVDGHTPDLVVIEAPSYGSRFGSAHDRSGLWWLVVDGLLEEDLWVVAVAPNSRAKYATGKGNADKLEVTDAISETLGGFPGDDDDNVADAMVLACMGRRALGKPVDGVLSEPQLRAMESVPWET